MRIRDTNPGDTVIITEGPAKGREVKIIAKGNGNLVAVHGGGQGQTVRGDLKVKPK
jgi:ribosomal protein L24